jgi:acetyltransferase-like isoleucine patch superfamily enzyme
MQGRLRKLVLAEGERLKQVVREQSAIDWMPEANATCGVDAPPGARNCCIAGHVELGEGAMLIGCYVDHDATVKLGPGTVAYACAFYGKVETGRNCTLLGSCVGARHTGGGVQCGDECVLASSGIYRNRVYSRRGYSLDYARDDGYVKMGSGCVMLNASLKQLALDMTIGSGMVLYSACVEIGYNDKTGVSIGDRFTVTPGYVNFAKAVISDIPERKEGSDNTYRSLLDIVDGMNMHDKFVQLLSHCSNIRIGDDVIIETTMLIHAQRDLTIGDGCVVQPCSRGKSALQFIGREVTLGKQSMITVATDAQEQRQNTDGVTIKGTYGDIKTGYRSRLCVTVNAANGYDGLELGDNETGYL